MQKKILCGNNPPEDINMIVEIPMNNDQVKYEYDKSIKNLVVDRLMNTTLSYPCNYGFIPNTLSKDGDCLDVLLITPTPIFPGVLVNCRPIGVLKMTDESGKDEKIISVPNNQLTSLYDRIKDVDDLPKLLLDQIKYFFEHYKDLDTDKWVKVNGFSGTNSAKSDIISAIKLYQQES